MAFLQTCKNFGDVEHTHNGIAPTGDKWFFEDYSTDQQVREELFKQLDAAHKNKEVFCVMENILHLPPEFKTRFRIDLDAKLSSSAPEGFDPYVDKLADCIFDVLQEYTKVDTNSCYKTDEYKTDHRHNVNIRE
jgi:hypothetical protein